jgi:hypothetical protein
LVGKETSGGKNDHGDPEIDRMSARKMPGEGFSFVGLRAHPIWVGRTSLQIRG